MIFVPINSFHFASNINISVKAYFFALVRKKICILFLPPCVVLLCFIHVCFIQVTMCGAPDGLTRFHAHTFLLLSHPLGSHNKCQYVEKCAHRGKSARREHHTLSLGWNKHGHENSEPSIAYSRVYPGRGPFIKGYSWYVFPLPV